MMFSFLLKSNFQVSYSRPNTADIKDTNLYVGNVPAGVTEDQLKDIFGDFGSILTSKLLKDQSGKNKGIAFIRFSKKAEADAALENLAGYKLPGSSRGLDVKVAEDHGRQKAAFYAGYMVGHGQSEDGDYDEYQGGGSRGGRGGGYGGRGGGYNADFGLQMFQAPGANLRGVGGNRYNPISRGVMHNMSPGGGRGGQQGFQPTGFSRAAFSGTRGMPARGGFSRGGSRGHSTWSDS